ncbi:replication restart helicase PriA [Arsenophonus symbiont of Ornithomya chloropus]|uniref:replication restart helicase PriA n=1 Tax=Arsenophonus symbiont of Ornithomya chloropus TaxID=634121 RepID=UPI0032B207C3
MTIVQVALPIHLMRTFDYKLPSNFPIPKRGCRVIVPFGLYSHIGIVITHRNDTITSNLKLGYIKKILDKKSLFSDSLWLLLIWGHQYYHYPIGKVLFHALPILLRNEKKITYFPKIQCKLRKKNKKSQFKPIQEIQNKQKKSLDLIKNWHFNLNIFIKKKLNTEQLHAIKTINSNQKFKVWLLIGSKGSGKTEVCLNVIAKILNQGKQILVLIPEISLILQTMTQFKQRLNIPIDVLHSSLSDTEKFIIWLRTKNGQNAILMGTRSALFTSFSNLGLIIVYSEDSNSYKQQEGWCYHARDLAIVLAKKENIPIILETETPSLESLYNIIKGKYDRLDLKHKTINKKIVQNLIALKGQPLQYGMSQPLIRSIRNHLKENNQIILFLNQRGYSAILICHHCGWIPKCLRCEKYYTVYRYKNQIRCHYCNTQKPMPIKCLLCYSKHLFPFGLGTEQLEEAIKKLFPKIPVTRIDKDTKTNISKKKLEKNTYEPGTHIFIGTQILTTKYHFPYVTLVALLNADYPLFSSDYRATEKFAQFYTKISKHVANKIGAGEVILQTYYPENPLMLTLLKKGYDAFAQETLKERYNVFLPPYTSHIIIRAEGYSNQSTKTFLQKFRKNIMASHNNHDKNFLVIGPIPALLAKRVGRFRWQLLLQHPSKYYLKIMLSLILPKIMTYPECYKVKWSIDVDPIKY